MNSLPDAFAPPPRLSVVAPCFNEAESLGEFVRRMGAASHAVAPRRP